MQPPLETLSENAQHVHRYLAEDPDRSEPVEAIVEHVHLSISETHDALLELEAAQHASMTFRGWSMLG